MTTAVHAADNGRHAVLGRDYGPPSFARIPETAYYLGQLGQILLRDLSVDSLGSSPGSGDATSNQDDANIAAN